MNALIFDFLVSCVVVFLAWGALAGLVLLFTARAKRVRRPAPQPFIPTYRCDDCKGRVPVLHQYGKSFICEACEARWVALDQAVNAS